MPNVSRFEYEVEFRLNRRANKTQFKGLITLFASRYAVYRTANKGQNDLQASSHALLAWLPVFLERGGDSFPIRCSR
jgi:hypothetical protein